jgi:hypothetical protein
MSNAGKMSDFITKAEGLLQKMDESHRRNLVTHELHEAQLKMYRDMVNDSINLAERRWNNMRQFILVVVGALLLSGLGGGVAISERPTQKELNKQLEEYTEKDETLRGFGSFSDDVYYNFEEYGIMTHEEADEAQKETEYNLFKEIDPNYKTRSAKKIK